MSTDKTKSTTGQDAIALLTADHKAVKALFKEFEALTKKDDADDEKEALVAKICDELTIHAQVEEEIFYPVVREAIDDDDLMDEADVEHASAKDLIAQLEDMSAADDHYDAKVKVLGEQIDHHVEEEQKEMFAKARKADVDVEALGARIAARKAELEAELGLPEDPPAATQAATGKAGARKGTAARK